MNLRAIGTLLAIYGVWVLHIHGDRHDAELERLRHRVAHLEAGRTVVDQHDAVLRQYLSIAPDPCASSRTGRGRLWSRMEELEAGRRWYDRRDAGLIRAWFQGPLMAAGAAR